MTDFHLGEWVETCDHRPNLVVPDGTIGRIVEIKFKVHEEAEYRVHFDPPLRDYLGGLREQFWLSGRRLLRCPPIDVLSVVGALQSALQELESM